MDLSPAASLRSRITVALGRTARLVSRLRGGGSGGTALPGLVVEKLDPGFLARTLGQLPMGVVVVSGTNGKTTTTKMVVQLLREQGLKVLTNRSGSNFVRGVLASLLTEVDAGGRLSHDGGGNRARAHCHTSPKPVLRIITRRFTSISSARKKARNFSVRSRSRRNEKLSRSG